MVHCIFENNLFNINKNLENEYNKLNILIKTLSTNVYNFQLIQIINEDAIRCNDIAEGIKCPTDLNKIQHEIDQDTFILVNHASRLKVLMQNYKLHCEIKNKLNTYNNLVKQRYNEETSNLVNIGKNAELYCLQKCFNIIKEENMETNHAVNIMKTQAKHFVISRKKFENDQMSLLDIKQIISRNINVISSKSETCLQKIMDINHQIIAGKNIFEVLLNIFAALIDSNEKIYLFITHRVAQKSTCLESLNIVNKPDNNLLPVVWNFFQLFQENKNILKLLTTMLTNFEDITDESRSIKIYIEKMQTYFESLNQKNKKELTAVNTADKEFWNAVSKFESVASEWSTLKKIVLKN